MTPGRKNTPRRVSDLRHLRPCSRRRMLRRLTFRISEPAPVTLGSEPRRNREGSLHPLGGCLIYLIFWATTLPAVTSGAPSREEDTVFLTQSAARRLDSSACACVSKMLTDA